MLKGQQTTLGKLACFPLLIEESELSLHIQESTWVGCRCKRARKETKAFVDIKVIYIPYFVTFWAKSNLPDYSLDYFSQWQVEVWQGCMVLQNVKGFVDEIWFSLRDEYAYSSDLNFFVSADAIWGLMSHNRQSLFYPERWHRMRNVGSKFDRSKFWPTNGMPWNRTRDRAHYRRTQIPLNDCLRYDLAVQTHPIKVAILLVFWVRRLHFCDTHNL